MADDAPEPDEVEPVSLDIRIVADKPVKLTISINGKIFDAEIYQDDELDQ
jgi:hypothetical protein